MLTKLGWNPGYAPIAVIKSSRLSVQHRDGDPYTLSQAGRLNVHCIYHVIGGSINHPYSFLKATQSLIYSGINLQRQTEVKLHFDSQLDLPILASKYLTTPQPTPKMYFSLQNTTEKKGIFMGKSRGIFLLQSPPCGEPMMLVFPNFISKPLKYICK